ncbi:MAG: hypothetical protein ACRYFU_17830 [Janthinobacterium lividum]
MRRFLFLLPLCFGCQRPASPAAQPAAASDTTRIIAALNRYYAHDRACLWISTVRIPHDYPATLGPALELFRVPTKAGLLKQTHTPQTLRVELTPLGQASWLPTPNQPGAGNLCYATPEVLSLSAFKPDINPLYGPVVQVSFLVGVSDQASWASLSQITSNYGQIKRMLGGPVPGTAIMRFSGGTWQVAGATFYGDTTPDFSLSQ